MKKITLMVASLCFVLSVHSQISQGQLSDFEDGTTQGWTNGAQSPNPPTNVPTGGPNGMNDNFLEETSAGGGGAGSKLVIQNTDADWTGNYFDEAIDFISANFKNGGNDDLFLRVAMKGGSNNTRIYTTEAINVPPSQTTWTSGEFIVTLDAFTIESGTNTVEEVLSDVNEIRILSSQFGSYNGDAIVGVLHIDNIQANTVLGTDDNSASEVTIYPNPVSDILNITSLNRMENFEIFNVSGQKITEGELNDQFIQVSNLSQGLYFLRLSNDNGARTIKFVKR